MGFFDVQRPMFRPLWLRALIVGLCLAWTVVEIRGGNGFWAVLFGAAALYLAYQFFVVFNPVELEKKEDSQ